MSLFRYLFVFIFFCTSLAVLAGSRKEARFYKIDKNEVTTRVMFTNKKGKQAGCHNFLKSVRVHRFNQFGFASCSLFTKKDCVADSLTAAATRKKPNEEQTILQQGYAWYPIDDHERGTKLRSWSCSE